MNLLIKRTIIKGVTLLVTSPNPVMYEESMNSGIANVHIVTSQFMTSTLFYIDIKLPVPTF